MSANLIDTAVNLIKQFALATKPEERNAFLEKLHQIEAQFSNRSEQNDYLYAVWAEVAGNSPAEARNMIDEYIDYTSLTPQKYLELLEIGKACLIKQTVDKQIKAEAMRVLGKLGTLEELGIDAASLREDLGRMVLSATPPPAHRSIN